MEMNAVIGHRVDAPAPDSCLRRLVQGAAPGSSSASEVGHRGVAWERLRVEVAPQDHTKRPKEDATNVTGPHQEGTPSTTHSPTYRPPTGHS